VLFHLIQSIVARHGSDSEKTQQNEDARDSHNNLFRFVKTSRDSIRPTRMKKSESPRIARIALGVPAVIGLSIPFALSAAAYQNDDLLARTGQLTDGRVTGKRCQNHGEIVFSYAVNGISLSGRGAAGATCTRTACEDVNVGMPMRVMYSSEKPRIAQCVPPDVTLETIIENKKRYMAENFLIPVLLSVIVFFAILNLTRTDAGETQDSRRDPS
jgi:hypothetical protein